MHLNQRMATFIHGLCVVMERKIITQFHNLPLIAFVNISVQRGLANSRHSYNISNAIFRVVPTHCIYEI
jgi:hypothetical protein